MSQVRRGLAGVGHRKIYGLLRADGHHMLVSTVELAMHRHGLLQPVDYTGPAQHIERIDVLGGLIHEYQHAA